MSGDAWLEQWPDTRGVEPPADHLYRSATWLLGRHPLLAHLVARISGVVIIEDGELDIDLDHLVAVINAVPGYIAAWQDYDRAHPQPDDEDAWYGWQDAGPKPDEFARGLSDFLVMSSGEVATLRLLATVSSERAPFRVSDLRSTDTEGQRLIADWVDAVRDAYAVVPAGAARPSSSAASDWIGHDE